MEPLTILLVCTPEVRLTQQHLAQIDSSAPGAIVRVEPSEGLTRDAVHRADIILGAVNQEWVADAPKLRWIHLPSAGADGWAHTRPDVLLTKSNGVFGVPIAEWVVGAMLMLTRNLHLYRDRQREARWEALSQARELSGRTVGIVGLGDLGRQVAKRVSSFGCRVIGARRNGGPPPEHVEAVLPVDELIPRTDILVVALPGTAETRGMISRGRLMRLRPGSYVINVGRGITIDEEALIDGLRSGHLAGAALDVTAVEPLPADNPLWQMPNVIITPHVSNRSPEGNENRRIGIFCENLRRFVAGEPLANLVDRAAGY